MLFGLITPATITRRTQTSQGSDGAPAYSTASVWTGRCYVHKMSGSGKWQGVGLVEVGMFDIYIPYLTGTSRPKPGDTITAGSDNYTVEFVEPLTEGTQHHLEVKCRLVVP
jgi:hypothetical protein